VHNEETVSFCHFGLHFLATMLRHLTCRYFKTSYKLSSIKFLKNGWWSWINQSLYRLRRGRRPNFDSKQKLRFSLFQPSQTSWRSGVDCCLDDTGPLCPSASPSAYVAGYWNQGLQKCVDFYLSPHKSQYLILN